MMDDDKDQMRNELLQAERELDMLEQEELAFSEYCCKMIEENQ